MNDYTICIYEFMLKDLLLSGADLIIYAYLYSKARNSNARYYKESFRSIGKELNINTHTVSSAMVRLVNRNLLSLGEEGICVKIDTLPREGGNVSKLTHEPLGEGGVLKLAQNEKYAIFDTEVESVSKLTQKSECAKIDTKLKLKRKEN